MAVIGIDPGTALTGYSIVEKSGDGSLIALDYGVIKTSKHDEPAIRLVNLYRGLKDLLSQYEPAYGAVERLYFQQNTTTAMSVGQARGVALLALAEENIKIFEYNPVEIKLAVSGYGKAGKKQVQEMVKLLLNLEKIPKPDDAADALAVAICHIHSFRIKELESKT